MQRERDTEQWLRRKIEGMGGKALKLTSPGNDGVPDRLVLLPGGLIYFVELKTDRGRLSPIQVWQQDRLKELGCRVRTVRGRPGAEEFIEEVRNEVHTPRLPKAGDPYGDR